MGVSGINFSGLGTGIDTESIIQQLLSIDRRPQDLMKTNLQQLQQRQIAYQKVSAQLLSLQAAASTIDRLRAFDLVTANSSDTTVATVSAQTGAQTGAHDITVTTLAKAQKISSAAQSSQTAPLGFTGQIVINGKAINVQASDSLQTLAANINAAQPGVTASIISPSANQFYLTIASNNTGLQGQISISDTAGGAFLGTTLGLFAATGTSLRHAISTTGAASDLFADSATSIGTLQGQTAPASGTVTIGTGTVSIDLATDSLSAIAGKINAASIAGVTASVVTTTDPISGASRQQLQINGTQTFTDSNNILANLGILQRSYAAGRELTAAQDATFTLDGLSATRATNSFSDAISGVTITLLKDGGASANLSVSSDTETIQSNIEAYVKAFNDTIDGIASLSQYDPQTGSTGPLFGDAAVQGIVDSLVSNATGQVSGLPSSLSLLSQVGITLDQSNHLVLDSGALSQALASNLTGVAKLFRSNGDPSDPAVQFVSSTGDTQPSGSAGYAVVVTQPATQATLLAGTAQTAPLAQDETLTFGGPLFGTSATSLTGGRSITLRAGSTIDDVISQINGDSVLGPVVSASKDPVTGALKLVSKQYGSAAEFAVVSGIPAAADSSGIGTTIVDVKGQDVAGTINGEAATGVGQFLTGSLKGASGASNGRALGLQLRITATAAGSYGTVAFTSGVADILKNYITTQTDAFTGALTVSANSVQDNINDIQDSINAIDEQLKDEEQNLRLKFTAMESAVAKIKAASAGLAQLAVQTTNR
ncbi:MAG TPA: flagellar filament capping protein FliD [Chthonomonadaceae bacterium]|nr:flagellar filament capping protein FliD [Chthonomonadaceae bacterium]